jgi:hypothetical protein
VPYYLVVRPSGFDDVAWLGHGVPLWVRLLFLAGDRGPEHGYNHAFCAFV